MGMYKYLRELYKQPKENLGPLWKERLMAWRREPVTLRIEHPTRLDRARSLGYKAKEGIILVRQRVMRGGRKRPNHRSGRRPKRFTLRRDLQVSYQVVAETRAAKIYPNCEVINSYFVAKDGMHYWYEIILVDKCHPVILADPHFAWVSDPQHRRRAFRGLTSAAKKSRGFRGKGKGYEKMRPSKNSRWK